MGHDEHADAHSGHGHQADRGLSGTLRYLRHWPRMWRSSVNTAVVELAAPVRGDRVLDVGAGMGPASVLAAERGALVTAIEPTPFLRRILSVRRLFQKARKRITIVDAGVENLLIPDDSFDIAWSVNTMHHWINPEQGAAELARVLRPSGRLLLVDEDFEDPSHPEYERFAGDGHGGDGHDDHDNHGFTMVDAERMGELFAAAGLDGVTAEKRDLEGRPVIAVVRKVGLSGSD